MGSFGTPAFEKNHRLINVLCCHAIRTAMGVPHPPRQVIPCVVVLDGGFPVGARQVASGWLGKPTPIDEQRFAIDPITVANVGPFATDLEDRHLARLPGVALYGDVPEN